MGEVCAWILQSPIPICDKVGDVKQYHGWQKDVGSLWYFRDTVEPYSGVPLAALLAKLDAPLGEHLRGKALASYIVASGSDGYSVVLSIAEADPSFHGGEILVADTRDGQPLGKSGPFQLIVSEDKRPARWVHNLVSISLQDAH